MLWFIPVIASTFVMATLETVLRYLRNRQVSSWSSRPIYIGAVIWFCITFVAQYSRTSPNMLLVLATSIFAALLWYAIGIVLGRFLWRSAQRS